jgi:hypothetical protein
MGNLLANYSFLMQSQAYARVEVAEFMAENYNSD